MPDGRFLSKSIAYSDQLGRVSLEADYLFARLIPHCDREGRMSGAPLTVKGMCCPLRQELTPGVVESALEELDAVGLIRWYEVDGTRYIELPGFANHQHGARLDRERPSKVPPFPGPNSRKLRRTPENSGNVRLSEVKRSEVKSSEVPSVVADAPTDGEATAEPAPTFRLAPYLDVHREIRGESVPPAAKWAKSFKALERKFGAEAVLTRWRRCLVAKGEFATPQWLGANWGDYAEDAPAKGGEKSALQELEELGAQDSWWTEGLEAARRKRAA